MGTMSLDQLAAFVRNLVFGKTCVCLLLHRFKILNPWLQKKCGQWKKKKTLIETFPYTKNPLNRANSLIQPDFCGPLVAGWMSFCCIMQDTVLFRMYLHLYTIFSVGQSKTSHRKECSSCYRSAWADTKLWLPCITICPESSSKQSA